MEEKKYTLKEFKEFVLSQDIIDILAKCNLVDENEITGRKMLCPFHNEKTPSLVFYEDHYHCFGCGSGGDVFAFLNNTYDTSFVQSAQIIADAYGKQLILKATNPFLPKYNDNRFEEEWQGYLNDMNNAPDRIRDGAKIFFPLEVGYDKKIDYYVLRFTSKSGKTLGFTKRRAFETDDKIKFPKWKHSSLSKSNISQCGNLFNLGSAVRHIRDKRHVILVEGPKDVIPWIMENHKEVVAISGTHNEDNTFSILPEVDSITLSLDSDPAGKKGMLDLACYLSDKMSLDNITFVDFDGLDPYDYYQKNNSLPEEKPIYELLTEDGLKLVYNSSNAFNKDRIVSYYAEKNSLSWSESESFFKMRKKKVYKKDISELERLAAQGDSDAIKKLKLKYGVE